MPLKTKVLISSVTNLSDARYATGMGADFIGFSMNDGDSDFIGYTNYTAITTWLLDMTFAGEFNNKATATMIDERAIEFGFKTIIVTENSIVDDLKGKGYAIILKQYIENNEDILALSKLKTAADYVVIESKDNFQPTIDNISLLSSHIPLLIGTALSPDTINELIENTDMEGIALKGSEEIRTGFVDLDAMADLLEAIEID